MNFAVFIEYNFILVVNKVLPVISDERPFTINTEGCTILSYTDTNESVNVVDKFISHWLEGSKCSESVELVSSNSSHFWLNQDAYEDYNIYQRSEFYCCYAYFMAQNNIANIKYGNCTEFKTFIKAEYEFVRTECFYYDNKIYDDYLIFDVHNDYYRRLTKGFNVLILGIESMSRQNFQRTMPLTAEFLKDRGSIQMLGYNKLGYNSYPNLFPVLMGKSFKAVRNSCITNHVIDTDKCEFIWDAYKRAGYHTILGSDSIAGLLGEYEYELTNIPTDFYLQPFISETINLFDNKYYAYHICFNGKYLYKVLLDYIKGTTNHLKSTRWFGMFWEESISHDNQYLPKIMDDNYVQLFNNLYLNDTILIMLSDHGRRWGDIAKTKYGRQEERLPLLEVLFPERFRNQYQEAYKHFISNSHRLTTPYDLHETLLDLLSEERLEGRRTPVKKNSIDSITKKSSLFLPISKKRTCDSIGIDEHWCTCLRGQRIKTNNKTRLAAAQYLVTHINKLLSVHPQCHTLLLKQILNVNAVKSKNKGKIFVVVIKTSPGDGVFDSTLYHKRKEWAVSGIVSRLNLYRNQSTCVDDSIIKLYCYCTP